MRTCINFCKNCGAHYSYQASGSYWSLDTPEKYNDWDYCPECKQAIIEALEPITKKTELKWVKTDDFTLEEMFLKQKEQDEQEEIERKNRSETSLFQFPKMQRVFMSMCNNDLSDTTHTREIKINNVKYHYTYWKNSREVVNITKEVRWDLIKDVEFK